MKLRSALLGAVLLAATAAPAFAQDDALISKNQTIYDAEGKRVGKVTRVLEDGSALVIYKGKVVRIGASTFALRRIESFHGRVVRDVQSDLLCINSEFTASMVLARCEVSESGRHTWKVRMDTGLNPDITVAIRLDRANEQPLDYYLLPRLDFAQGRLRLADHNRFELEGYRFDTLDFLHQMGAQIHLRKVA